MPTIFDTPSNQAYEALHALPADRRWYSFNVSLGDAQAGHADRFVMTLWSNRLLRDATTGDYWYKVPRLEPDGSKKNNRTSLCTALRLAEAEKLPMTGILKDYQKPKWCSTKHRFAIATVIEDDADDAIWLRVVPYNSADVGCEATTRQIMKPGWAVDQLADAHRMLETQIDQALQDRTARLERLANAPELPTQIVVTTTVFVRNPDVVAEVLEQANGKCGYCRKDAPFLKKSSKTPYLEVHHKVPLSKGGKDTVENAIAACPNCHRERHYG